MLDISSSLAIRSTVDRDVVHRKGVIKHTVEVWSVLRAPSYRAMLELRLDPDGAAIYERTDSHSVVIARNPFQRPKYAKGTLGRTVSTATLRIKAGSTRQTLELHSSAQVGEAIIVAEPIEVQIV